MSAYVVSKAHINYLIHAGLQFAGCGGPLRWDDPATPAPVWTGGGRDAYESYIAACRARVRELTRATADRVGRMLWEQNHRSVSARYSDLEATPAYEYTADTEYAQDLGRFEDGWHWSRVMLDPVAVLKALSCYKYQSCETPDWERTEAAAFCEALRDLAISRLPGYDAAPWDIDDVEDMAPGPGEPSVEVPA